MKPQPIANPLNPWSSTALEYLDEIPLAKPQPYEDATREILSTNDSPDIGFRYSINPYRGCMHACAYCYARPTHEYLGFGAGTDFDTKIAVKARAPELLRQAFERKAWTGELIVFSGVTDCYQPLEASLRLTRGCLEVCAEYQNPVGIITKAPLIERDLDVLQALHQKASVSVTVSIPLWDPAIARAIEPGVATPRRRLQTIARLAAAGIPVGVNVAPLIPGLEADVGQILSAAREAGATWAGYVLLRLPGPVKLVFEQRIKAALPGHAEKVLHRIRETRGGAMYDPRWGKRQRGTGEYAQSMEALFEASCRKLGLNCGMGHQPPPATFRRPPKNGEQLTLL